ncbi:hypothetical protein SARC_07225 [Sphaeroforma arctica JP610]|uniref:F-box domain-containing protein n=1 Tax=Sphaeroforma arctica JP610 TaxID=667725 RepID=A0A0L0FWT2_9EUKA|nr:hypothetical protein SARC_07225 [Sphaeroforma arctica JP610]KNC80418.1 hypothetical protein SARC_07225 [Sphaeroforma arctica JP610]|eukprot:XP_014154320.1 hypothetical protein SARC_07225 [Sphaeroforma arctica JP610]
MSGVNYFEKLSDEIVVLVMSHCEYDDLDKLGFVCQRFNFIIQDDNVWRDAFMTKFWLRDTQFVSRIKNISWKREYLARVRLLRVWERHRGFSKEMDHGLISINQLYIDGMGQREIRAGNAVGIGNGVGDFVLTSVEGGELRRGTNKGRLYKGRTPMAPNHVVTASCVADARTLVYGTSTGALAKMNLLHEDRQYFEPRHGSRVTHIATDKDNVMSCSAENIIKVWALETRQLLHTLYCKSRATCIALGQRQYAVAGCADGMLRMWSLASTSTPATTIIQPLEYKLQPEEQSHERPGRELSAGTLQVWSRLTGDKLRDVGVGRIRGRRNVPVSALAIGQSQVAITYGSTLRVLLLDQKSMDIARLKRRLVNQGVQLNKDIAERKSNNRTKRDYQLNMDEGMAEIESQVYSRNEWEKRAGQMNANGDLNEDEMLSVALAISLSHSTGSVNGRAAAGDFLDSGDELDYVLQYSQVEM